MTDEGFKKGGLIFWALNSKEKQIPLKFVRKSSNLQEISDLRELKTLNEETKTEIHEKLRICENKIVRNTKLNES